MFLCILKTNSTVLELFTQPCDQDRHICPKGQMFCFFVEKYPSWQTWPVSKRGALESPLFNMV